jgi:hypothetical protein
MITGGAAYGYWALKSPVPIRPREPEKGSTARIGGLFRPPGITPALTDSPDFHGLSPPPRWGRFLSRRQNGPRVRLFRRSQLALKPAVRPVAKGIEPVALGAFKPARPVAVTRHWGAAVRTARIRNCLPHTGNLRLEPQPVHSKYNPCGRKFDSARSGHRQKPFRRRQRR